MSVSFSPVSQALSNSNITIKSVLFHSYSLTFLHFLPFTGVVIATSWIAALLCLGFAVLPNILNIFHGPLPDFPNFPSSVCLTAFDPTLLCSTIRHGWMSCGSDWIGRRKVYTAVTLHPWQRNDNISLFHVPFLHLFLFPSLSWSVPFYPEVHSGNSVWLWKSICLLLFLTLSGYVIISPSHFFICLHRPFHQHFCCRGSTVGLL